MYIACRGYTYCESGYTYCESGYTYCESGYTYEDKILGYRAWQEKISQVPESESHESAWPGLPGGSEVLHEYHFPGRYENPYYSLFRPGAFFPGLARMPPEGRFSHSIKKDDSTL